MSKKQNLNNELRFFFCFIIFDIELELDIDRKLYLSFNVYILSLKLLFIFFFILCKTKCLTKIIQQVWLFIIYILTLYLINKFIELSIELL